MDAFMLSLWAGEQRRERFMRKVKHHCWCGRTYSGKHWHERLNRHEDACKVVAKRNATVKGIELYNLDGGGACPAQYEARTADGRYVYIRYRGGYLSVGIGATPGEAINNRQFRKRIGGEYDGSISQEAVLFRTGMVDAGQKPEFEPEAVLSYGFFVLGNPVATKDACKEA